MGMIQPGCYKRWRTFAVPAYDTAMYEGVGGISVKLFLIKNVFSWYSC